MSDTVERLAEKWLQAGEPDKQFGDVARWWLRAIADELEDEAAEQEWGSEWFTADLWLREQADG